MTKLLRFLMFAITVFVLAACTDSGDNIQYFPFQSEKDGKWGMMSPDGKVLFEEEFKFQPTVATCGRFWAMNEKGYYELYTTDKTPRKIGDEYRYVSLFHNGKAIVTQRDHPASVIDKEGKVLVDLNKIDGKTPDRIFNISDGLAVFMTDTVCGVIDYEGKVVVKPKYSYINPAHDGKMVAYDSGFTLYDGVAADSMPEAKAYVLDTKGEVTLTLSNKKYHQTGMRFYGDYLPVGKSVDGEMSWGIINSKGEEVVKISPKYRFINEINEKGFIYTDEEGKYGMKGFDGTTLVRAKYDFLQFADKDLLIGGMLNEKAGDNDTEAYYKSEVVDLTGAAVSKKYNSISPYIPTKCVSAIVCIGDDNYGLIDRKGERLKDTPDMAYATSDTYVADISSDYVDIPVFLDNIGFSANGVDSLTFASSVTKVLDRQARYFSYTNKPKASDYTTTSSVSIYRTIDGVGFYEEAGFPQSLAVQTFRQEKVIDYVDYYYNMYWYHMRNVPTGFKFRSITPSTFTMSFDNFGPLRGKLRTFYTHLAGRFKKMGTVSDENDSAVVVNLPGGRKAVVWLESNAVKAVWGNLSAADQYIGKYIGNKEALKIDVDYDPPIEEDEY